jgi:rubredoxin
MVFVGIYIGIGTIAVIVIVFLVGMRGRGRMIECPECGAHFKKPAFAEKQGGVGFSLPGIGAYTCPQCKHRGNTSSFRYVDSKNEANKS